MSLSNINKQFFFLLFLLLINLNCNLSDNDTYRIPFGLYYTYVKSPKDLIDNIFFNFLYVNLSLGIQPQIIPCHLDINSQTFYIPNQLFIKNNSSTYESISKNETTYSFEDVIKGFNSKDVLTLNSRRNKINFILETKTKKDNEIGSIGLAIPTQFQSGVLSFFNSLKQSGFISSNIWTLKFSNKVSMKDIIFNREKETKIIGELIIGDEPHNYETNKKIYNKDKYIEIEPLWFKSNLFWDISFYKIYLKFNNNQIDKKNNNNIINVHGDHLTELNPDIGFIVAPIEFFQIINQYFFYKYSCFTTREDNTLFRYTICDNSMDITSFPDIFFEHDNVVFNLTYKDLFIFDKEKNKYIFLIIYEGYTGHWVFGRLFLTKYQLTFNEETKKIGFYTSMIDLDRDNEKVLKNKIISIISFIFIILVFALIIIFILYTICHKIRTTNKKFHKRINQLDEEESKGKNNNGTLLKNIEDKNII